jgi:hypothetical protein
MARLPLEIFGLGQLGWLRQTYVEAMWLDLSAQHWVQCPAVLSSSKGKEAQSSSQQPAQRGVSPTY